MIEFFLGVSLWFWPIFLLEIIFIWSFVVNEYNPGWPSAFVLVGIGISDYFFGTGVFLYIWHNPLMAVVGVLGYLVLGTGYTFFKWWLHNENIKDKYVDAYEDWKISETRDRKSRQTIKDKVLAKAGRQHQDAATGGNIGPTENWYVAQEIANHLRKTKVTEQEVAQEGFWSLFADLEPEQRKAAWRESWDFKTNWDEQIPPEARNNKVRIVNWLMYWPFSLVWTLIDDIVKKLATAIFNRIRSVYERISENVFRNVEY